MPLMQFFDRHGLLMSREHNDMMLWFFYMLLINIHVYTICWETASDLRYKQIASLAKTDIIPSLCLYATTQCILYLRLLDVNSCVTVCIHHLPRKVIRKWIFFTKTYLPLWRQMWCRAMCNGTNCFVDNQSICQIIFYPPLSCLYFTSSIQHNQDDGYSDRLINIRL